MDFFVRRVALPRPFRFAGTTFADSRSSTSSISSSPSSSPAFLSPATSFLAIDSPPDQRRVTSRAYEAAASFEGDIPGDVALALPLSFLGTSADSVSPSDRVDVAAGVTEALVSAEARSDFCGGNKTVSKAQAEIITSSAPYSWPGQRPLPSATFHCRSPPSPRTVLVSPCSAKYFTDLLCRKCSPQPPSQPSLSSSARSGRKQLKNH